MVRVVDCAAGLGWAAVELSSHSLGIELRTGDGVRGIFEEFQIRIVLQINSSSNYRPGEAATNGSCRHCESPDTTQQRELQRPRAPGQRSYGAVALALAACVPWESGLCTDPRLWTPSSESSPLRVQTPRGQTTMILVFNGMFYRTFAGSRGGCFVLPPGILRPLLSRYTRTYYDTSS